MLYTDIVLRAGLDSRSSWALRFLGLSFRIHGFDLGPSWHSEVQGSWLFVFILCLCACLGFRF